MPNGNSLLESMLSLPSEKRNELLKTLSETEAEQLLYDWEFWARPNQLPPTDREWLTWLLLTGRGYGKTRSGAELVNKWAKDYSPIALIAQTKGDARDTMVEVGGSSILQISPPWFRPEYEPSKRRLTWPNGCQGIIYSGDEPGQLRGPQHQKAWCDELAKYQYPQDTWDNLMFGLRIGDCPQVVVTSTPRPIPTIKALVADTTTVVTKGHTLENKDNLAPSFIQYILKKYEGTRLGRQELAAEILDDNPNALWDRGNLEETRVREHPPLIRIVVAIDPAASDGEESSETGIVVAGTSANGHGYVLADKSLHASPEGWGSEAVTVYHVFHADRIIGEVNNGGDMVAAVIRATERNVPFTAVRASRGKLIRAEPVSALSEQKRIHLVGTFPELEDQLCQWQPGDKSPDRLDAFVWAFTELMLQDDEDREELVVMDSMEMIGSVDL